MRRWDTVQFPPFPKVHCIPLPISTLIRNAGASPRKLAIPPSICVSCYSRKNILERNRGICLPHSWWKPPIPNKRLLIGRCPCCHSQVLPEAHYLSISQGSFGHGQGVGLHKVLNPEQVLLSLYFPPFPNSCSPVER